MKITLTKKEISLIHQALDILGMDYPDYNPEDYYFNQNHADIHAEIDKLRAKLLI